MVWPKELDTQMRLILEPEVYLIAAPNIKRDQLQEYLKDIGCSNFKSDAVSDGEELIELAGRIDYDSYKKPRPGGNKAYLNNIISKFHGSVTEEANYTFAITGISRCCSHELIRHRHFSPSQRSQRYCDESDTYYIIPSEIYHDDELCEEYKKVLEVSRDAYIKIFNKIYYKQKYEWCKKNNVDTSNLSMEELLGLIPTQELTNLRKHARQYARYILPQAVETRLFLTGNIRTIRNFLELRASRYADTEIRILANRIYEIMIKESPNIFADYKVVMLPDGSFELQTDFRKV